MGITLLWWITLFCIAGLCRSVHVTVPEKKKVAMLFQPVVLHCQFTTTDINPPVVQWKYKSYCKDRTKDAFGFSDPMGTAVSQVNELSVGWDPHLDCLDKSRTVRIVASKQDSAITLGDYYKDREVTIINNADLQIGKLHWGDSGVYYCLVTSPIDINGNNEDRMEMFVLGRTGVSADLLPRFAVDIFPEWAFVGLVIFGTVFLFLMIGICWCQCCPYSCCCYIRCPCCPNTCCCPRALYEAGKAVKTGNSPTISVSSPPYYIPNVPMAPVPVPTPTPQKHHPPTIVENNPTGNQNVRSGYRIQADKERDSMKVMYYVEKELAQFDPTKRSPNKFSRSMSELSSLHEPEGDFRQSYQQVRKHALPPIRDADENTEYRPHINDTAARRAGRINPTMGREAENYRSTWNRQRPKSEHLERKAYHNRGPTTSLDELVEFANSYTQRPKRPEQREAEEIGLQQYESQNPFHGTVQTRMGYLGGSLDEYYNRQSQSREYLYSTDLRRPRSPPQKRDYRQIQRPRTANGSRVYDSSYLTSVLDRKSQSRVRGESFTSDLPSRPSSRQSSCEYYYNRFPSYKAVDDDVLPPYTEREVVRPRPQSERSYYHSREGMQFNTWYDRRGSERCKKTVWQLNL
ncbi:immunoglobulin-like domain-containing receptor 2 isoform X2 [Protopterus annectens]|uniref:immunoglobulin-like domain-containing receptor 2 isoform X2 n=1 Tax=Protopterus annectens TaxID=7888 RepID=UPI001CF98D88|nr:immunoglobulin-like domain-containing receptor 2 isoform X2 [Protopterus annectens]